ncbi:MAG: phycobiliprotein lyase, partial [Waterburya sp.]
EMDAEDGLVLITEYDTMSIIERFWFVNPDLRLRSSTVKRFGGFNTATFCTESRVRETTATNNLETSKDNNIKAFAISGW